MRCTRTVWLLTPVLIAACASPERYTLAELRGVDPDMKEIRIEKGLDQAQGSELAFDELADSYTGSGRFCRDTRTLLIH